MTDEGVVIVEHFGGGAFSAPSIGEVFAAAWQIHVDNFRNADPSISNMFAGYIAQVRESDFKDEESFRAAYVGPDRIFLLALDEAGTIVGHAAAAVGRAPKFVSGTVRDPSRCCELWRMAVAPRAQGRGVARKLQDAVKHFAACRQCEVLHLSTGSIMAGANRLYPSLGYELVGKCYVPAYLSMEHYFEMPISQHERDRHYGAEITVRASDDGWLEARHRGRLLGGVNLNQLWERRGEHLDSVAEQVLAEYYAMARQGLDASVCVLGHKIEKVKPAFEARKVRVRKAKTATSKEDELAVRRLFCQSWESSLTQYEKSEPQLAALLQVHLNNQLDTDLIPGNRSYPQQVFLAEIDGVAVGTVGLRASGEVVHLGVHPLARGLGVTEQMMTELEKFAKRKLKLKKITASSASFMVEPRLFCSSKMKFKEVAGETVTVVRVAPGQLPIAVNVWKFEKQIKH